MLQIFALFLVHAYSTRVWKSEAEKVDSKNSDISAAAIEHGFQSPEGHSKLIMDGPWRLLWPCLLLWPFFQTTIGLGFIHNARSMFLNFVEHIGEHHGTSIAAVPLHLASLNQIWCWAQLHYEPSV